MRPHWHHQDEADIGDAFVLLVAVFAIGIFVGILIMEKIQ